MIELIVLILTLLVFAYISILVFKNGPKRTSNIYFCLFILSIVAWIVSLYLSNHIISYALFWTRLTFVSSSLLVLFLFQFVLVYPENKKISMTRQWALILPFILITVLLFTDKIIQSITYIETGTGVEQGRYYYIFLLFFATYVLGSISVLLWKFHKAQGLHKARLLYLLIGLGVSLFVGSSTNLLIPYFFKIDILNVYGPYSTLILISFTTYAILKHQLFDIRVVIRKILVYSVLLAIIFATYSIFVSLVTRYLPINPAFGNFFAAIFIAIGFDPLRRRLQAVTEKYLFVSEYDADQELKRLGQTLSSVIDLDEALRTLMQITTSALKLDRAATLVLAQESDATEKSRLPESDDVMHKNSANKIRVKRVQEVNFPAPKRLLNSKMTPVLDYFNQHPELAVVDLLHQDVEAALTSYEQTAKRVERNQHQPLVEQAADLKLKQAAVERLIKLKVAVVIPILVNKKLIGIVFLGEKLSNDSFYEQDLNFLSIVGTQTANAIEKARFFEEDQLKSEFVSIASHELLTPTAAIEGYLSMILEEKMGQVDPKAEEYLWKVFNSSKRLSVLVKDLLSVSRIESGRIKIEPKIFDLNEVVSQQIDQLQVRAKDANLTMTAKYPNHQSLVFADPERVAQAVVNLASNGLKYTKQGGVTITVVEKTRFYEVQVTDTGVGISTADREHLFQKFSRIENQSTAGIMGTGLGLYITKAIIEMMGGSVWVRSTVGKGSTFAFTVPKTKTSTK